MLQGFAEAETGIEHDALGLDAFVLEYAQAAGKVVGHGSDDIAVLRMGLHGLRRAGHVHDDEARLGVSGDARHGGIATQTGDVVDDVSPGIQRSTGDGGLHGIDGDQSLRLGTHGADHRQHAAEFLGFIHGFSAWAGGFTADVQNVRPFREQREGMLHGAARIIEAATIREAVRSDVDNAHDETAMGEIEIVVAESPAKHGWCGLLRPVPDMLSEFRIPPSGKVR